VRLRETGDAYGAVPDGIKRATWVFVKSTEVRAGLGFCQSRKADGIGHASIVLDIVIL
jgi:hypothetical protein